MSSIKETEKDIQIHLKFNEQGKVKPFDTNSDNSEESTATKVSSYAIDVGCDVMTKAMKSLDPLAGKLASSKGMFITIVKDYAQYYKAAQQLNEENSLNIHSQAFVQTAGNAAVSGVGAWSGKYLGAGTGAASGGLIGAAIGSIVPGIGTAAGAMAGVRIGMTVGKISGFFIGGVGSAIIYDEWEGLSEDRTMADAMGQASNLFKATTKKTASANKPERHNSNFDSSPFNIHAPIEITHQDFEFNGETLAPIGESSSFFMPKEHTASRGDTLFSIARDHGISEDALLQVPGNEYLASQAQTNERGKNIVNIEQGQNIYIPLENKYNPQAGWWRQSDYGSKIQTSSGAYNFLSSFNQGNHESIYSFAKNVGQEFHSWNQGLGQGIGTALAKRSMEIKLLASQAYSNFDSNSYSDGSKEYVNVKSTGTNYASYQIPDFSKTNKFYVSSHHYQHQQTMYPQGNTGHLQYRYSSGRGHHGSYTVGVRFPLAIDLDNDGLELIPLSSSNIFYDIDDLGVMNNLGWTSPKDALLAIDLNQDQVIHLAKEISFKLWDENAKTDLDGLRLAFDSNKDGKINQEDEIFNHLVVWQDANQNGISEPGEVKSLSEVGIEEILLDETVDIHNHSKANGNQLLSAVKLKTDGRIKGALYDVGLATSNAGIYSKENEDSIELYYNEHDKLKILQATNKKVNMNKGNYSVALGNEQSQTFIANDNENSIMDGAAGDDSFIGGDKNDWAKGGDGADSYSMGKGHDIMLIDSEDVNIDGGDDYDVAIVATTKAVTLNMTESNIEAAYGNNGNDVFIATNSKEGVFIDAGNGDDSLEGSDHNDILIGGKGKDKINAGKGNDVLHIDTEDDLREIDAGEGEDTVYITGSKGIKLDPAVINAENIYATEHDDQIEYSGSEKVILFGNGGNDYLRGGENDDYLDGGPGDDLLEGGFGSDRYAFYLGAGHDRILNIQRKEDKDILLLYKSIKLEDIFFLRIENDLVLRTAGNNKDSLRFLGWYEEETKRIDQILYNVGTDNPQILTLKTEGPIELGITNDEAITIFSMDGDDKVSGGSKDDFISLGDGKDEAFGGDGDDILAGGPGDGDYLRGWRGNDTYLYNIGDGKDVIYDNYQYTVQEQHSDSQGTFHQDVVKEGPAGDNDRIKFGAGIKPTDLHFKQDNNNLIIDVKSESNDSINITNWFNDFNKIENLSFEDKNYKLGTYDKAKLSDTFSINNRTDPNHIFSGFLDFIQTRSIILGQNKTGNYDILEGITGRSSILLSSNSFVTGSDKNDYIYSYSNNIISAGDGDDSIFIHYSLNAKESKISGGNGRDQFILVNNLNNETTGKSYINTIVDFSSEDDYIEIRGFKDINSIDDLMFIQDEDDVIIAINNNTQVRVLNFHMDQFNSNNLRFAYMEKLEKQGGLIAKEHKPNHLFGSNGDDILDANNASFAHLTGGIGNDLIKTNGALLVTISEGPGDDVIECSANTKGNIRYSTGNLSKGNFGHDHVYCDFTKIKIQVDRQEQVKEILNHLSLDKDGNSLISYNDWSVTLHGTNITDASLFSVWEEII